MALLSRAVVLSDIRAATEDACALNILQPDSSTYTGAGNRAEINPQLRSTPAYRRRYVGYKILRHDRASMTVTCRGANLKASPGLSSRVQ
jgi:hypothetical protein